MTLLNAINQTFELQTVQPTSLLEGPFRNIPPDIFKFILFLANDGESTRLVSRVWNVFTLPADPADKKKSNNHELKQTIRLITEKLNLQHAHCIADLHELQDTHQSLSGYVATFGKIRRLFLIGKGLGIGILRKLPKEERDQLQIAVGDQLPDSMKNLFEISKLDFMTVDNVDLDVFFTLLQSYKPLSREAVLDIVALNNIEFVKLLLANGPISEENRSIAAVHAIELNDDIEIVKLLLANGSISGEHRKRAIHQAIHDNNSELVILLLANLSISGSRFFRGWAVWKAAEENNLELVILLLDNGPIDDTFREWVVKKAVSSNNHLEFARLLLPHGPVSQGFRGWAVCVAALKNNLELVKLLLANGPISEEDRNAAVNKAVKNNNPELIRLLLANESVLHRVWTVWKAAINNNRELVQLLRFNWKIATGLGVAALFAYVWYSSKKRL